MLKAIAQLTDSMLGDGYYARVGMAKRQEWDDRQVVKILYKGVDVAELDVTDDGYMSCYDMEGKGNHDVIPYEITAICLAYRHRSHII